LVFEEAAMFRLTCTLSLAFLVPFAIMSQASQNQAPDQVQREDGGSRQVLESIVIPPKPNAPFTATLHTEWIRTLPGSGTMTVENNRRIARDSSGRIYQERWILVPKNGKYKSQMNAIQISNPIEHTAYTCMMDDKKICRLATYMPSASGVYDLHSIQGPPPGPLADHSGYSTREDLGHQTFVGVDTVGTKETVTVKPGTFGNDQEVTMSREYWYASELAVNLVSKRSDLRFGTQEFTITELNRAEPDSTLFALPEGFAVVDQRESGKSGVD
jgi:hypothetical protein